MFFLGTSSLKNNLCDFANIFFGKKKIIFGVILLLSVAEVGVDICEEICANLTYDYALTLKHIKFSYFYVIPNNTSH